MTNLDWVAPQACTLPTIEQPLRVAEFDTLFAHHLVAVDRVDRVDAARARLVLAAGPRRQADEFTAAVLDLTERESACCSFFTFTVDAQLPGPAAAGRVAARPGDVVLDIEVPPAHVDVLAALVTRAQAQAHADPSGAARRRA
ncbi:hypothetical protein [Pedococcus bigeumensis]|uniref:Uncharacterized protein n=1 Tax=Pedococcus bigeumensis TaxID=433644 RepID=A0A502CT67_9MICO|nr:hypothetical protein [Pedococcus bigeumensis]TPG16825.1 hypothetical protein EAH86_08470 [Pedococcus bigeumensis]